MRRILAGTVMSGASAVLATLAFGPFNVWWLVFVAFVPMIVAQHRVLPERWSGAAFAVGIGGFVTGYLAGLLDPTFAWWMRLIPVLLVVPLWFAGRLDRRFHARTEYRWFALATPLAWAAVDFARGGIPMIATRASLPYALFEHPSLIQPVSITGLVGLNLLIVCVNWSVAGAVLRVGRGKRWVVPIAAAWVALSVVLLQDPAPQVRVAAIQPGLRSAGAAEFARNVAQTRDAAARGARLIVWREMTLAFDPALRRTEESRALARETKAYLVIGYAVETRRSLRNEAVVIAPDGTFLGTYGKQHPALMFAGDAKATGQRDFPVYDAPIGRLATIICFDLDFTDTSRGMARHGAQLVAVPSLDPRGDATKHYPLLVFRAVEDRLTMVKAESKYASAIVDPYGRIVARAVSRTGKRATLVADVPLGSGRSPFVSYGHASGLVVVAAAVALHIRVLRKQPEGGAHMDAVTLLTKQHSEAKALFERIEASSDPQEKQRLLTEVIAALRTHTKIEEEVLYSVIREQVKGGGKMFEEAMQEHEEAKKAMRELEGLSPDTKEWQDHFEILMHGVLHHAGEEEAEMFPKLKETVSKERLEELGNQLEADSTGEVVIDLTTEELMEQAKASDIEGRSNMNKAELEEALGHR